MRSETTRVPRAHFAHCTKDVLPQRTVAARRQAEADKTISTDNSPVYPCKFQPQGILDLIPDKMRSLVVYSTAAEATPNNKTNKYAFMIFAKADNVKIAENTSAVLPQKQNM